MHKLEIEVGRDILKKNKDEANQNLTVLKRYNIRAFDILGSIGSGKTSIIEKVAPILERQGLQVGAIAGDVAGEDDFLRHEGARYPGC